MPDFHTASGEASVPPGYRWLDRWPRRERNTVSGGLGLMFAGLISFGLFAAAVSFALGGFAGHRPIGMALLLLALSLFFPATLVIGEPPPTVTEESGALVLHRPLRGESNLLVLPILLAALCGITLWGFEIHFLPVAILGAVLVAFFLVIGTMGLLERPALTLGADRIRMGDKLDAPWEQLTDIEGRTQPKSGTALLAFRLEDPRTGHEIGTGTYQLMPKLWHVEPNALLSLITYMAENPEARATVTTANLRAMLSLPN
ncbi:hypothetical protein ACFVUS_32695 [Nocardia sp. NPDC058058]|uniref:hypothetical protein n=1 Tax=Nocardia sp. NPDC058058 TaxID=3346317 RepID=UPI0036DA5C64